MNTYLDLEKILPSTLRPAPLSDALVKRLESIFTLPDELDEAVFSRFLGAMNEEQLKQDERFEKRLRVLKPASVSSTFTHRVQHNVQKEIQVRTSWCRIFPFRQSFYGFLSGAVAACVAFVFFTPKAVDLPESMSLAVRDTSMERSALDIEPYEIVWDESGMIPCQSFEVTYRDTFSVRDSHGNQLEVEVPAKHQVSIPLEIY